MIEPKESNLYDFAKLKKIFRVSDDRTIKSSFQGKFVLIESESIVLTSQNPSEQEQKQIEPTSERLINSLI